MTEDLIPDEILCARFGHLPYRSDAQALAVLRWLRLDPTRYQLHPVSALCAVRVVPRAAGPSGLWG